MRTDQRITIGTATTVPVNQAADSYCLIHAADPDDDSHAATYEKRATETNHRSIANIGFNGFHPSIRFFRPSKWVTMKNWSLDIKDISLKRRRPLTDKYKKAGEISGDS